MIHLGILLVLAAASVRKAEPHNLPRPPGPAYYWDGWRWRDDRVLDVDTTGAGAVTYINIYGSVRARHSRLKLNGAVIRTCGW